MFQKIGRFSSRNMLYPVVLSSMLTVGFWAGRVVISESFAYSFLLWDLFLAWVPYLLSLAVVLLDDRFPGRWWIWAIPFVFWIAFFPNAPYIVTDLIHFDDRPGAPLWYQLGFFASYAWAGVVLAIVSLNIMHTTIRKYVGGAGGWLFVISAILLSGFGIYLGRFLGWNSWDIFVQPHLLLIDLIDRVLHPIRYIRTYGVTAMFGSFLFVCYLTFTSIQNRGKVED
ncbi:MAG: DUF1361 domain-containing protein [Rudaea sp.]